MTDHIHHPTDAKKTLIRFVREWGNAIGLVLTILLILGTAVTAGRTLVTKEDLKECEEAQDNALRRSQEAQEKFLQEWIVNAADASAKKASRETLRLYFAMKRGSVPSDDE